MESFLSQQFNQFSNSDHIENIQQKQNITDQQVNAIKDNAEQKQKLIIQLEAILATIQNLQSIAQTHVIDPQTDTILQQLAQIQRRAIIDDFADVKRLAVLAIGKRLLMIELIRQKLQHQQKQQKRNEIEDIFRQNRIKKIDFPYLVQQKIQQNTFVVQPYSSGNGFIQSQLDYSSYQKALIQCQFLQVVKNVNKIFFKNFTGVNPYASISLNDLLFRITFFLFIIFFGFTIVLPFVTFPFQEYIIIVILAAILVILSVISINSYIQKPNDNNQLEQTIEQIHEYFKILNKQNQEKGKYFEWVCPKNFMYLQVRFKNGIPLNHEIIS